MGSIESVNKLHETLSYAFGMSYDIDDEAKVMKEIREGNYNIENMSKYADEVCITTSDNEEFSEQQYQQSLQHPHMTEQDADHLNPTSFGNIAYTLLHDTSNVRKTFWKKLLDEMIELDKKISTK